MYKRKLSALNHVSPNTLNVNDDDQFKNLIIWLEDKKIRHYKLENRTELRNTSSPKWINAYKKYLSDLACPVKSSKREEELEWLLIFSIRLEYGDNVEKYSAASKEKNTEQSCPKVVSENPLDNLDTQSSDFIEGVNKLAKVLNIQQHPDHLVTLKAVSKFVSTRLSPKALENPDLIVAKGDIFPFEEQGSGFAFGDPVLSKAAKVLRLLYIRDLRELQTSINECIVAVQAVTANPKTDTKLGQVGR